MLFLGNKILIKTDEKEKWVNSIWFFTCFTANGSDLKLVYSKSKYIFHFDITRNVNNSQGFS